MKRSLRKRTQRFKLKVDLDEEDVDLSVVENDKECLYDDDECMQCLNGGNLIECETCLNWYCLSCLKLDIYPQTETWSCPLCSD